MPLSKGSNPTVTATAKAPTPLEKTGKSGPSSFPESGPPVRISHVMRKTTNRSFRSVIAGGFGIEVDVRFGIHPVAGRLADT